MKRIIIILIATLIITCIGGASVAAIHAAGANDREIDAAESLWRAQGYAHYVIIIDELNCIVEVEIQDGRVVRITPTERCERDGRTVEDLFVMARRNGDIGMRCITQGCACDDRLYVESEFHPQLGYPTRVYIRIAAEPNWQHPDAWRYLIEHQRAPECSMMVGDKLLQVLDLRPLP